MCAYKTLFNKLREAQFFFNLNNIKPLTQVNKCGGEVNLNWKDDWNAKYGGQAVFIGNGVGRIQKPK